MRRVAEALAGVDADVHAEQLPGTIEAATQVPELRINGQERVLAFEITTAADFDAIVLHGALKFGQVCGSKLFERCTVSRSEPASDPPWKTSMSASGH